MPNDEADGNVKANAIWQTIGADNHPNKAIDSKLWAHSANSKQRGFIALSYWLKSVAAKQYGIQHSYSFFFKPLKDLREDDY